MSRISQASQAEVIRPIPGSFLNSQSSIVRLGRRIGIGAEGEVYEIQDSADLVAKIYHEPPPPEKAEKLVALSSLGNDRLFNLSAWPVDVLLDAPGGEIAGFVMKKISGAEEVHALHSPKSRLQKFPEASWSFLIYVAANIARAVAAIHEHGFVIGDLNPKNILVTRKATVYLLDVDSFQVSVDGRTYRCDGGFAEYTPPELQGVAFRNVDRAQEHDCFGLAVVIFQLLFMGRHPFSGRYLGAGEMPLERAIRESRFAYGADAEARKMRQPPGTLALDSLPSVIVDLFRRAFLTNDRPQPREWIEPLDTLAKSLKKCALHSGHYYYKELRDCPWCGIETHARVRLFNFLLPVGDSQRGHFRLDEIWKEIVCVEPPDTPPITGDKMLQAPNPSPDVVLASQTRLVEILSAIALSGSLSFVLGLVIDPPFSIFLFVALAVAAKALSDNRQINLGNLQTLFNSRQSVPQDPLAQKVQARLREAEEAAQRLREQYDREGGNERWGAERFELLNRKETYKNLAQIRQFKLQQLEAEPRQNQLDEFLDQFEIKDAEIKGVVPPVKMALLSHGIETAADVIEEVRRIPSVGRSQAERLLEWRRDLERNFVYDPGRGVPPQARVNVEREVDALRFRLECELSAGANNLRRMKHEIETSRQKLQPALANARQELAQAEKDWKIASRRKPFAPILLALFIAFIIGTSLKFENNDRVYYPETKTERQEPPSGGPGPANTSSSSEHELALKYYNDGAALSAIGNYEDAVDLFKKATESDPSFSDAYVSLGYALYRLGRYNESIDASWRATYIKGDFAPYYNLGLAYMAREDWFEARDAFGNAVTYCKVNPWDESYSYAYYYLGLSQARDGAADVAIEALRKELADNPQTAITRFELGALYLGCGRYKDARAQYKILKNLDPTLAEELRKLIEKHAARKLA